MNQVSAELNQIRNKAEKLRNKIQPHSLQKEFDAIINNYENIIEELVYENNC